MALEAPYAMLASMDVDDAHVDVFDNLYNSEHIPSLVQVPGVLSITRFVATPFTMRIAGEAKLFDATGFPRFTAVYELAAPDVVASDAWASAVEEGRWPAEVRPHTRNRQHVMLRRLT
jgi:hypothetical protein